MIGRSQAVSRSRPHSGFSESVFYLAAARGSVQIPIMPWCDLSEFLDNDEAHVVGRVGELPQVVENRVHDVGGGEMFRSTNGVFQTIRKIRIVATRVLLQAVCIQQQDVTAAH